MPRYALFSALLATVLFAMLPSAPSFAVNAKDKMATCKFGADDQKLAGAQRTKFIKDCMSTRNDPRGAGAMGTMGPTAAPPQKN